ncbi:STM4012 family radical SAM protein [Actinocorallia sp. API 0066]|uniref:STM4012 family radical SAM protein n=1 Tax=Actinocorallia sp. API 0066 TaxID=2896846 RepID=UPI001E2F0425|nr:STM4012 family radical SAM protein [Actinocorallia sp. API 0066]MCD0451857.1 STM4012 family radical SAM protein [Actinocorallia sp. API 0066]
MTVTAPHTPLAYGDWSYTSPYESYVYAYPHKTAYRPLDPAPSLTDVWAGEDVSALFLYLHVPFCEIRCGFCNLFTRTGAPEDLTTAYLGALERQASAVLEAVEGARFALAAFGGGTPTYLTAAELERLCLLTRRLTGGTDGVGVPLGVETSPGTATPDRLAVLRAFGATRVSIGVQSFAEAEARAAVRPQKAAEVVAALDAIRDAGFPVLNVDLIYGIEGQTERSWIASIDRALEWAPEELYLYPLYVRPKTGLDRLARVWDDERLRLYRAGRDHLLALGYEQVSMRMFRRPGGGGGTEYCCQEDGMVGLGCGARSYTSRLHYSFEYAVEQSAVRAIIDDYVLAEDFSRARVGFRLDEAERRRRHLLQSLLQADGLDVAAYAARFGTEPAADFDLAPFAARGWLEHVPGRLVLTPEGLAHSDALGPALFSPEVRTLMAAYTPR